MSDQPIVLDQPDQIALASVLALRSALKLQTKGLKMRGASALTIARKRGFTTKRTAQGALEDVNAILAEYGF